MSTGPTRMRSGRRWARTALTGGGVAAVVYAVTGLFDADARPLIAVFSAVTGIVGSVFLGGVAVFSVAAGEGDPPNWLVGQTGSLAGLCVWGASRVAWRRRCIRRGLERL